MPKLITKDVTVRLYYDLQETIDDLTHSELNDTIHEFLQNATPFGSEEISIENFGMHEISVDEMSSYYNRFKESFT